MQYGWSKLADGGEETQYGWPNLDEYTNGIFSRFIHGFGSWHRTTLEVFFRSSDEKINDGASVIIDDTEISIEQPFKNQNGGTTQYSLTIRRSTGRFIETFASENISTTTHSGTCLIYR